LLRAPAALRGRFVAIKTSSADRSDRVILFTLVDLLTQFIFLALFLVALYKSTSRTLSSSLQSKLLPYQRAAAVELATFVDAATKLVPVNDVDKSPIGSVSEKTTKESLLALADLLRRMQSQHTSPEQVALQLAGQNRLGGVDRAVLLELIGRESKMTAPQRAKLLADAKTITRPRCFGGAFAFAVEEVPGGYIVSSPIGSISKVFLGAVAPYGRAGDGFFISANDLPTFGRQLGSAFRNCDIRVSESTTTDSEEQYKNLGVYFWLGGP